MARMPFDSHAAPERRNLLLEKVEFQVTRTARGTWRRHLAPGGQLFEEYRSDRTLLGLPLLHYTSGRSPETGRTVTARGVVAIGRRAVGLLAIGQGALGIVAIGQASGALLLGIGQATCGLFAFGQAAFGVAIGIGQVATGALAVGQLALGGHVLAQVGIGRHVWDTRAADPEAVAFFKGLWAQLR
jgi:hypothetical protein